MTEKLYPIESNSLNVVNAYCIDLYQTIIDGKHVYNPSIGLELNSDTEKSRIHITTEIFDEDPYKAIYMAYRACSVLAPMCYDGVNVIDVDNNVFDEDKYSIAKTVEIFKLIFQKTSEEVVIH